MKKEYPSITEYYCDRCGEKIESGVKHIFMVKYSLIRVIITSGIIDYKEKAFDICPK